MSVFLWLKKIFRSIRQPSKVVLHLFVTLPLIIQGGGLFSWEFKIPQAAMLLFLVCGVWADDFGGSLSAAVNHSKSTAATISGGKRAKLHRRSSPPHLHHDLPVRPPSFQGFYLFGLGCMVLDYSLGPV